MAFFVLSLHCFQCFVTLSLLLLHVCGAASILAPNVSSCHLPLNLPSAEPVFDCCAPFASYSPRLFRPNSSLSSTLHIRRPSHYVSEVYAKKLARAYALMKGLPAEDPRSFVQQANIHCAYCNSVYNQINSTQPFQVHESWLFFPFHRWYLYFHERILAKLLGEDESFALTFWNYDHHNASSMPWLFDSFNDTLVSFLRDPLHVGPSSHVSLNDPFSVDSSTAPEDQLRENDNVVYRALIRDGATTESFFGSPLRHGEVPEAYAGGTVELYVHNTLHLWVGNKTQVGLKDMGSLYAAARDPVFYAHHAQIDRLWEVWKTLSGHKELTDEDYLNSEFVFYNEDAELVRVKVGDALDTTVLGYVYEEVELPWMDAIPKNSSSGPAELTSNYTICAVGEVVLAPCSLVLQRELNATGMSPWLHHRLVLTVQGDPAEGARIDIYVNLPSADANTGSGCHEFLYGLNSLSPFNAMAAGTDVNVTVRPRLYERLVDLNLTGQSSIVVTLVPSFPALVRKGLTLVSYSSEYVPPAEMRLGSGYIDLGDGDDYIESPSLTIL